MATDHRPVLFLDTNALHYVRLYIEFAKANNLAPLGTHPVDPREVIKAKFTGRVQRSYGSGLKLTKYLREQTELDARIEYSPVTYLELACGLLRGKAMLEVAREGFANRMWNRMEDAEILASLSPTHFKEIGNAVDNLEDEFEQANIELIKADPAKMSEVWSIAPSILGIVFLDVGDCIVYASALLAEAEELITADRYLKQVTNNLENPGGAQPHQEAFYVEASKKLKTLLAPTMSRKVSEITLPKASTAW